MWSKEQTLAETPTPSDGQAPSAFNVTPSRSAISLSRSSARLGSSLQIRGEITGSEDLQIDCVVEGPVSVDGNVLTVSSTAQLNSEIHAGEVVVRGKIAGNVHGQGRVEITKDGSITGDIACARIRIEDGAHFKARIEIDPARSKNTAN